MSANICMHNCNHLSATQTARTERRNALCFTLRVLNHKGTLKQLHRESLSMQPARAPSATLSPAPRNLLQHMCVWKLPSRRRTTLYHVVRYTHTHVYMVWWAYDTRFQNNDSERTTPCRRPPAKGGGFVSRVCVAVCFRRARALTTH